MNELYDFITNIISNTGIYGLIISSLLIFFESIIPPLPLSLFITLLFINYGTFLGFFISWFFTILGCFLSYFLSKKFLKKRIVKIISKHKFTSKFFKIVDSISFSNLTLLVSLPITPAFLVNIICGVSDMNFKKFFLSIIIGKISLVLYCGIIGTSLVEALKNPIAIIKAIVLIFLGYIISKIVNKKLKID